MEESGDRVRIAAGVLLLVALAAALGWVDVLPGRRWENVPLHSAMEAIGVLATFLLAGLIRKMPGTDRRLTGRRVWVACGLVGIGTFDLFHAVVPPGDAFVLTHSLSVLAGGLLFAMAWIPVDESSRLARVVPLIVAAGAAAISLATLQFPEAIPSMIYGEGFSRTAVSINLIAGSLFLLAAFRFFIGHDADRNRETILFAALSLLFALSSFLFSDSLMWDANWWLWHLCKLAGYLLASVYLLQAFGRVVSQLGRANTALEQEIADRRQDQEALRRKGDELQRKNAELEEFAYVASHDLKAPLRAVANLALLIDEGTGERLDAENRQHLRTLRQRVIAMDGLIDGLLNYARLGRREEVRVPIALEGFLTSLIAELSIPSGFSVELTKPLPTLHAEPRELRQIFQNLITNAIVHHDRSEGHVQIRASETADMSIIEVSDDGRGIDPSQREQVFRMFSTGSRKAEHAGIGLAVVRKLVLANGGRIELADNAPRGVTFRIFWPRAEATA